jgi:hypothetical protein
MGTVILLRALTFGRVAIPVKLWRAGRAEKVSFRQVHEASGTRVRQALWREPGEALDLEGSGAEELVPEKAASDAVIPFPAQPQAVEVSRSELAKGYEYEPGRFVVLSRNEMESISPRTAHETQILDSCSWRKSTRDTSRSLTTRRRTKVEYRLSAGSFLQLAAHESRVRERRAAGLR